MEHIPASRWMRENAPGARVACRVSTGTALRAAVHDGIGIGHLLCFMAEDDPTLCQVRPPEPALETGLWLLTHEDLAATGRVRVFLDFLAAAIGRQRSSLAAAGSS
jgi:DNA-binding transcriptional LysR family regulator